jgi:hypothetical protein
MVTGHFRICRLAPSLQTPVVTHSIYGPTRPSCTLERRILANLVLLRRLQRDLSS